MGKGLEQEFQPKEKPRVADNPAIHDVPLNSETHEFSEENWLLAEQKPGEMIIKGQEGEATVEGMTLVTERPDGIKIIERFVKYRSQEPFENWKQPPNYNYLFVVLPDGTRIDMQEFLPPNCVFVEDTFEPEYHDIGSDQLAEFSWLKERNFTKPWTKTRAGAHADMSNYYYGRKALTYFGPENPTTFFRIFSAIAYNNLIGEDAEIKQDVTLMKEAGNISEITAVLKTHKLRKEAKFKEDIQRRLEEGTRVQLAGLEKLFEFYKKTGVNLEPQFEDRNFLVSLMDEWTKGQLKVAEEYTLKIGDASGFDPKESVKKHFGTKERALIYYRTKLEERKTRLLEKWEETFGTMKK